MVELKFQYSEKEYLKAYRQQLIMNKTIKKADPIIMGFSIILLVSYAFISGFNILSIVALTSLAFWIIVESAAYFFIPMKAFRSNSKFSEQYHLTFTDDTIIFKTATLNSEAKWNIYSKLLSNQDFYFLSQNPQVYTIIPKRVFDDKQTMENFENMASKHLEIVHVD